MRKSEEDTGESPNQESQPTGCGQLGVANWPHQGRGNAALAAFPWPFGVSWGSVCSPNLPGIPPLIFSYKYQFQ